MINTLLKHKGRQVGDMIKKVLAYQMQLTHLRKLLKDITKEQKTIQDMVYMKIIPLVMELALVLC